MHLIDHDISDWQNDDRDHLLTYDAAHDFHLAPLLELVFARNAENFLDIDSGHAICTSISGDRNSDRYKIEVTLQESKHSYAQRTIHGIEAGYYPPADFSILA